MYGQHASSAAHDFSDSDHRETCAAVRRRSGTYRRFARGTPCPVAARRSSQPPSRPSPTTSPCTFHRPVRCGPCPHRCPPPMGLACRFLSARCIQICGLVEASNTSGPRRMRSSGFSRRVSARHVALGCRNGTDAGNRPIRRLPALPVALARSDRAGRLAPESPNGNASSGLPRSRSTPESTPNGTQKTATSDGEVNALRRYGIARGFSPRPAIALPSRASPKFCKVGEVHWGNKTAHH